jgi:hypothetical protein
MGHPNSPKKKDPPLRTAQGWATRKSKGKKKKEAGKARARKEKALDDLEGLFVFEL